MEDNKTRTFPVYRSLSFLIPFAAEMPQVALKGIEGGCLLLAIDFHDHIIVLPGEGFPTRAGSEAAGYSVSARHLSRIHLSRN